MNKRNKETLRDALLGTLATMRKSEVAQSSKTPSSINEDPVRKQRIFPKKFTANCVSKAFSIKVRASKSREKLCLSFSQLLDDLSYTRALKSLQILALGKMADDVRCILSARVLSFALGLMVASISMGMDIATTTTLALGSIKDLAGIAILSALLVG